VYKITQGITLLCALIFLCIKSYEYRDKFHHYEITLKDGRIADGHIQPAETTTNTVVIEGRWVKSHADLMEGTQAPGEKIEIERKDIAEMGNYGPWHNTYTAIYFTLTGLHALHVIGGAFVIFMIWGPLAGVYKTDPERYINRVEVSGLFWHFVDLVWIFLFPVLYLL